MLRPLSADCTFVFCEGDVLRLPKEQRDIVRVMLAAGQNGQASFRFDAGQSARVISELLPALERAGAVTLDGALAERIGRRPLTVKAYFDREDRMVVSKMVFRYGEEEIDPLDTEFWEETETLPESVIPPAGAELFEDKKHAYILYSVKDMEDFLLLLDADGEYYLYYREGATDPLAPDTTDE